MLIEAETADERQSPVEDKAWRWATQRFGAAMEAARGEEPLAALAHVDAILGRCPDYALAAQLGVTLAGRFHEKNRLIAYHSTLLALRPDDPVNRLELAKAVMEKAAFAAALDLLERLPQAIASTPDTVALKMRAAGGLGDEARFDRVLAAAAAADESEASAQYVDKVATALAATGDEVNALRWLDGHAGLVDSSPVLLFRRASLLYGLQRWEEADALFARLEAEHPSANRRQAATVFRARMARNSGDDFVAQALFLRAFGADPANLEACEYLVRQNWLEGENEAADALIERFAAAAPDAPAAVWLRAEGLKRRGLAARALDVYRAGLDAHGGNVEYCCRLADLLADSGEDGELREVLDRAAAIEPASPRVFSRRLAAARRREAPPAELVALCEDFLAFDGKNAEALLQRANSLLRLGRRVEAYTRYAEGARLNPTLPAFWRAAAGLAVSINRKAEAAALANEARGHFDEGDPSRLCALAGIHEAADDMDAALAFARKALKIDAASVEAHATMGRLLVAGGRFSEAWPHLLDAKGEGGRSQETTRLLAQTAAAFRFLRPSQADLVDVEPIDGLFPETLFEELAARAGGASAQPSENLVLHVTSSLAAGGAERQVASAVASLAQSAPGHAVELAVDDVDPATGRNVFLSVVEEAGVPVHVLRQMREAGAWRELLAERREHAAAVRLLAALPADMGRVALPLYVVIARRRPRVVHLWQDMIAVAGAFAAILAGVPRIVLGTRSTRPIEQQRFRRYFHHAYGAFLARPGVTLISNSRNGASDYEAWLDLPAGSVEVIYNGYDFARMRSRTDASLAAAAREEAGIPADALVVGGVMRLSFEKRPELWTEVVCELARREPRVHGLLVGEGPMRADLEREIASRGLSGRIRLVGQQSPVEPWMSAMDLLFLSSITEGLPNVLIEAQALGVPVATMRVGGAPEAVAEGRTAVIADEGDVASIADVLGGLLFDPARRAAFSAAGREWTESTFSTATMLARLAALYRGAS